MLCHAFYGRSRHLRADSSRFANGPELILIDDTPVTQSHVREARSVPSDGGVGSRHHATVQVHPSEITDPAGMEAFGNFG